MLNIGEAHTMYRLILITQLCKHANRAAANI